MTDKLFCEVQRLAARKRRNEERIPREDLEGKYRKSYERLCLDLKEAQGQLRTAYTERIREISSVVAELPYIDFSQDAGKARLMERWVFVKAEQLSCLANSFLQKKPPCLCMRRSACRRTSCLPCSRAADT